MFNKIINFFKPITRLGLSTPMLEDIRNTVSDYMKKHPDANRAVVFQSYIKKYYKNWG